MRSTSRWVWRAAAGHQHNGVRHGDRAVSSAPAHDRRRLARVPVGDRRRHIGRLRAPAETLETPAAGRLAAQRRRYRPRLVSLSLCQPALSLEPSPITEKFHVTFLQ